MKKYLFLAICIMVFFSGCTTTQHPQIQESKPVVKQDETYKKNTSAFEEFLSQEFHLSDEPKVVEAPTVEINNIYAPMINRFFIDKED
jgi:uncharacterized protein YcfL